MIGHVDLQLTFGTTLATLLFCATIATSSCCVADESAPVAELTPLLPTGFTPKTFSLPAGFSANLVAGPPLVTHPTMGCFDDTGRLFVCNNAGVNMSAEELEQHLPNSINMLEDLDADGVFDRTTVFADKMTFPMGAAWHAGALYVASPPNIWRLQDTTGDGVADKREIVVDKFGYNGNAASIHGCFFSPDGRLFWCDGYHGHEFKDKDGNVTSSRTGSYIFSCWPDGSDVRIHCGGGMDNPVEVDFTEEGDVIGTVNIMYSRPRVDCLVHWQYGGAYPHREAFLEEWPITGKLLGPIHRFGHVAVSGTTRYRSGAINEQWRNNFFVTQFNLGKVVRVELERSGSTYSATERQFLSCNNRDFHPTDIIEDADGSLLVIDTGGWFYRGCPTSQIAKPDVLGGIYRIRRDDMPSLPDPRGNRIDWATRADAELMQHLGDARYAVREKAIQECVQRGEPIIHLLGSQISAADSVPKRSAIWAVTRMIGHGGQHSQSDETPKASSTERPASANARIQKTKAVLSKSALANAQTAIRNALEDPDSAIRQMACHALAINPDPAAVGPLTKAAADSSAAVRREAFTALGRAAEEETLGWLFAIVTSPQSTVQPDREERHALSYAMLETGIRQGQVPSSLVTDRLLNSPEELIVLNQLFTDGVGSEQLRACIEAGKPDVLLAALDIIRVRNAKQALTEQQLNLVMAAATQRAKKMLADKSVQTDPDLLRALLRISGDAAAISRDIAAALRQQLDSPESIVALLNLISNLPPGSDSELQNAINEMLNSSNVEWRAAAIYAAGAYDLSHFAPRLHLIATAGTQPATVRLAAINVLASDRATFLKYEIFDQLVKLATNGTIEEQTNATRLLSTASLNTDQLNNVAVLMNNTGPQQLNDLVPLFRRGLTLEQASAFLNHLENARSLNSVPMIEVSEVVKSFPAELHERANALLDKMKDAEQAKLLTLDSLIGQLKSGDAVRGREVFFSEKAKCATCHVVGKNAANEPPGKRIGPDLTTIGANRTPQDLLESIIFPSATIVRQYEPYTLVTTKGRTVSGLVIKDTSDEVTIQQSTGDPITIVRSDIEELVPSTVSIMPKGLDEQLSGQQIADMVAWLQTLR